MHFLGWVPSAADLASPWPFLSTEPRRAATFFAGPLQVSSPAILGNLPIFSSNLTLTTPASINGNSNTVASRLIMSRTKVCAASWPMLRYIQVTAAAIASSLDLMPRISTNCLINVFSFRSIFALRLFNTSIPNNAPTACSKIASGTTEIHA